MMFLHAQIGQYMNPLHRKVEDKLPRYRSRPNCSAREKGEVLAIRTIFRVKIEFEVVYRN